jgi:hypothetical protein
MSLDKNKLDNLNRQIMMYQSQGYHVLTKDENTYTAIMEKEGEQNILIHILLAIFFFWLLFVPNLLYYLHAKKKKQITVFG